MSVTFTIDATVASLITTVNQLYASGDITKASVRDSLLNQLTAAQKSIDAGKKGTAKNQLNAFISLVQAQSGKSISPWAATLLIDDAKYVIAHL